MEHDWFIESPADTEVETGHGTLEWQWEPRGYADDGDLAGTPTGDDTGGDEVYRH
jgi:hypothetical protein